MLKVAKKCLITEDAEKLDKDLCAIQTKLNSIYMVNQQTLKQIHLDEVNETCSKYAEHINHQYNALNSMMEQVKKDPECSQDYMKDFQILYEGDKSEMSLNVFYSGVVGKTTFASRPLLEVYFEHCNGNRSIMKSKCFFLANLFHTGMITLMAYTIITEDDEDHVMERWLPRVAEIQAKIEEVLERCEGN